jgi:hypothetical protein
MSNYPEIKKADKLKSINETIKKLYGDGPVLKGKFVGLVTQNIK